MYYQTPHVTGQQPNPFMSNPNATSEPPLDPQLPLSVILATKGLQKYTTELGNLGFSTLADFKELNSNDIVELAQTLGLNFVEQKKLRNMIQAILLLEQQ
jgi:hypothetical protein